MKKLMKCQICSKYTISKTHCNKDSISPHPIASGVEKNIKERIISRIKRIEENEMQGTDEREIFPY